MFTCRVKVRLAWTLVNDPFDPYCYPLLSAFPPRKSTITPYSCIHLIPLLLLFFFLLLVLSFFFSFRHYLFLPFSQQILPIQWTSSIKSQPGLNTFEIKKVIFMAWKADDERVWICNRRRRIRVSFSLSWFCLEWHRRGGGVKGGGLSRFIYHRWNQTHISGTPFPSLNIFSVLSPVLSHSTHHSSARAAFPAQPPISREKNISQKLTITPVLSHTLDFFPRLFYTLTKDGQDALS